MKHWKIIGGPARGIEQIVKTLLKNRGLTEKAEIEEFFNPQNPSNLKLKTLGIKQVEIAKALKRIKKAIAGKEKIIVYGDYDADGICGTAILWETLKNCGADVLPYIPHRVEEGYGLSKKGIDNLLSIKPYTLDPRPSLIITVDHGITAKVEVDYAKKNGVDVIITDHHQPPAGGLKVLPKSNALIWSDKISGAAVAWVLAKELATSYKLLTTNYLDLVAIATIADLLPLKGFNRSLVKFGLLELNKTKRPGLLALLEEAGLPLGKIGVYEVGFIITPRLNAAGRIEHALDSLRLLCTPNQSRAKILAQKLNEINTRRQKITEESFFHARGLVRKSSNLIFISHSSYNEGVIGLVAGKLSEEFFRPAIVVSEGKTHSKASARSINGFNIIETLRGFNDLLIDCGGHPMAAGFTVETAKLEELKVRLLEVAQKEITPQQLEKTLKVDCETDFSDVNWALFEELLKFEPFGKDNPEPVFLTRRATIKDLRLVGPEGKHLKLIVSHELSVNSYDAIGFGLGKQGQNLKSGDRVDLAYTILVDSWNGQERLQLKIKDLNS